MDNIKYTIKVYVSKGSTDIPIYETEVEDLTTERIDLMRLKRVEPFKEDANIMLRITANN